MSKVYTYVDRIGSTIYHRYIDGCGKRHSQRVHEHPFSHYKPVIKNEPWTDMSVDGTRLKEIKSNSIRDAVKVFYEDSNHEVYGQNDLAIQFISDLYPYKINYEPALIKVAYIDIETNSDQGFPNPKKAKQEITAITLKMSDEKEYITFSTGQYSGTNCIYHQCENEVELLNTFLNVWNEKEPDIVTGWNCKYFDIEYIIRRCAILRLAVFKLSPFYNTSKNKKERLIKESGDSFAIIGVTILDYMELYKKFAFKNLESYSLNFVSYEELGEKKIDYSDVGTLDNLYKTDFQRFIDYNIRDVQLVENLENKLRFIEIALSLTYITKCKHENVFSSLKIWDTFIYNKLRYENHLVIPPKKHVDGDKSITGGYVKEPQPKLYKWIVTFDLTSLYPHIMMQNNISPDVYLGKVADTSIDACVASNGARFRKDKVGFMPAMIETIFNMRKTLKDSMLYHEKRLEEKYTEELATQISNESAHQKVLKIMMNSLYGACANPYFRYFNLDIAESITSTGREIIKYAESKINEWCNNKFKTEDHDYVVFIDTDSLGVHLEILVELLHAKNTPVDKVVEMLSVFSEKEISPLFKKWFDEFAIEHNAMANRMHMKREKIIDRGLWRGKKHYVLQVYDNEGVRYHKPIIHASGIESRRSSTPSLVKKALNDCIDIMLNKTERELQDYVGKFKETYFNSSIYDIAFPRGVTDIDKWIANKVIDIDAWQFEDMNMGNKEAKNVAYYKKGTPIHVKAAINYNNLLSSKNLLDKYQLIKNGDKIKFVYLKEVNPYWANAMAFKDVSLREFDVTRFVDYNMQLKKSFLMPLESISTIVNMQYETVGNLSFFFGD
jgi:DNA polymerase elongation subunit (family B)